MEQPIDVFKEEMFWMTREDKALLPWVKHNPSDFMRMLFHGRGKHPFCHEFCDRNNYGDLVRFLTKNVVLENELLDLLLKALLRAEIRFVSRYVPQRSNEERLTGNLVSEIDNAIFLVRDNFRKLAMDRYSEVKEVDFYYYDLSRGGRIEKETGADLGFIIVIDLPDFPYTVSSITLQAKKIRGNHVQIDIPQYEVLNKIAQEDCAYLFYDMNLTRLSSPIVTEIQEVNDNYKKGKENNQESFSIDFEGDYKSILRKGTPLSIYLIKNIIYNQYGRKHSSFEFAYRFFEEMCYHNNRKCNGNEFGGRIGIVSLGRKINLETTEESMKVSIGK